MGREGLSNQDFRQKIQKTTRSEAGGIKQQGQWMVGEHGINSPGPGNKFLSEKKM